MHAHIPKRSKHLSYTHVLILTCTLQKRPAIVIPILTHTEISTKEFNTGWSERRQSSPFPGWRRGQRSLSGWVPHSTKGGHWEEGYWTVWLDCGNINQWYHRTGIGLQLVLLLDPFHTIWVIPYQFSKSLHMTSLELDETWYIWSQLKPNIKIIQHVDECP